MMAMARNILYVLVLALAAGCTPQTPPPTGASQPQAEPPEVRRADGDVTLATGRYRNEEVLPVLRRIEQRLGHTADEAVLRDLDEQIRQLAEGDGLERRIHLDFQGSHEDVQMLVLRHSPDEVSVRFEGGSRPLLEEIDRIMKEETES
jgi:hypothetical protein